MARPITHTETRPSCAVCPLWIREPLPYVPGGGHCSLTGFYRAMFCEAWWGMMGILIDHSNEKLRAAGG